MQDIRFCCLHDKNDPYFQMAMKLYHSSFPDNERQTEETIISRIESGNSRLFAGIFNEQVVSMGILWNFSTIDFVLLDYLAVDEKMRQQGLGSRFFRFLAEVVCLENKSMVLEVEDPAFGENHTERKKRVLFYLKNGAFLLQDVPYILPPLDNTTPTHMLLMVYPFKKNPHFTCEEIKRLILFLYSELYNRTEKDVLFKSFINKLPPKIILTNQYANLKS